MSKNSDTESIMPKGYDFPTSEEAFAADYRISYDRNEKAHVLEDFDGKQYKWISSAQSWQEMVCPRSAQSSVFAMASHRLFGWLP